MRPSYANVVSTLALLIVGGSVITASQAQTATKKISICVAKKGTVKVLAKATAKCKKGQKKLQWNITGPTGATGPRGLTGPAGATGTASAPSALVGFFDGAACPAGWSEYAAGRGRYVVGLNPGAAPGATVGTALGALEDRATGQHSHGVQDPGHSHAVWTRGDRLTVPGLSSIAGNASTGSNLLPAWDGNPGNESIVPGLTGITIDPAGAVTGTNAPYVQLLACRKD